jgi:trehalose utilization protein
MEHEHPAGAELLAGALEGAGLGIRSEVSLGWPSDEAAVAAADALVLYGDGLDAHVANGHEAALARHMDAGKGLVVMHFALEPSPGPLTDLLDRALGGRFDPDWSVNPKWELREPLLADHPVNAGVAPFVMADEFYFHLRFQEGVAPILQALPPLESLGFDGPRSGNPAVRSALEEGRPQILAWVYEGGGGRAFGYTGGHYHYNWGDDNLRKLVLNGVAWAAGVEIPPGGIASAVPPLVHHQSIDESIARGKLEDVRRHLAVDPARANQGRNENLTPLHQAILRRQTAIAHLLLESGADPNRPDSSERTPLHLAVERGEAELIPVLIARGAVPNHLDRVGWTPLHHAAAKNDLACADALLAGGADPMTLSERGGTALHEAAASGDEAMLRLLLNHGVDPAHRAQSGVTALDVAREAANTNAIHILSEPPAP